MNPLADLSNSFRGWSEILAGKSEAIAQFRTSPGGFAVAVVTLLVAILLSVAAQSAAVGMPGFGQVMFGLLAQGVTVALLGIAMARALKFLRLGVPLNALFVPTLYALAYMFVIAIPLTLFGPNGGLIAILALGFLLFRAGQVLAGMKPGIAVAFAGLCVIVLVVVPNALYMLLSLIPSA